VLPTIKTIIATAEIIIITFVTLYDSFLKHINQQLARTFLFLCKLNSKIHLKSLDDNSLIYVPNFKLMTKEISPKQAKAFHKKIFTWWDKNKRSFPWRDTDDPYKILVSEVMLQQTQTTTVISKFNEFIEKYPDAESLAKAPKQEVLSLWSGLGYNRRALWLQEAAQQLSKMEDFPKSPKELQKLKGIGKYSASSILIFAFNQELATVDTNIRRILITEGFAKEDTAEKELFHIAEQLLPKGKSRDWHNALMDYGAVYLTASVTGISPTTKQPKFKGSDREKRGKILKYLIDNNKTTFSVLEGLLDCDSEQLKSILDKMIKDGLIVKQGKNYLIE